MSLDIDWSLLGALNPDGCAEALSRSLIGSLNKQLSAASRPSFIGPVSVTSLNFGTVGPQVEVQDIRDVWRAFEQGDEDGDRLEIHGLSSVFYSDHGKRNQGNIVDIRPSYHKQALPTIRDQDVKNKLSSVSTDNGLIDTPASRTDFPPSVVGAVGLGRTRGLASRAEIGKKTVSAGKPDRPFEASVLALVSALGSPNDRTPLPSLPISTPFTSSPYIHRTVAQRQFGRHADPESTCKSFSPPPSGNSFPMGNVATSTILPSLQLHLRYHHTSNLQITLLTSLQINYPSSCFMCLPLRLVVTGFTISANVVVAYTGSKNRVHFTILDDAENVSQGAGGGFDVGHGPRGAEQSLSAGLGQRLLPALQIESEIGHADAHVLRNVGKVERFIVDVIRKTIVDELVFPNFQTVAL